MNITLPLVALLGLSFGSFVNALVWRLHKKRNFVSERSECTHCHHALEWYDLMPVLSWVLLGGRCRYCKKRIDDSPLTELGVMIAFVASYIFWPFGFTVYAMVLYVIWLIALVMLAALFLYDLKWTLLPDALTFPLMTLGVVWAVVYGLLVQQQSFAGFALSAAAGVMSVAGLYGFLYWVSKGAWVGFGDVKLGVFMGLVLGWQNGLLSVMLANTFAFLVVVPGLLTHKMTRKSKVPFGPFLILATYVALLFGTQIIAWYISIAFPVEP